MKENSPYTIKECAKNIWICFKKNIEKYENIKYGGAKC